jgi:signal transduction histidine kinase
MTIGPVARRFTLPVVLSVSAVLIGVWGFLAYQHSSSRGLPYRDSFASGKADEWKALGGTWELVDGSMRNDSDERGAKLVTGSTHWVDYSIEADVMLLGMGGDAGLLLRSSDEEQGVDAYSGYYAGLRTIDDSLVLGRAGHGWVEMINRLGVKSPAVRPSQWYHLKLLAFGCQLAASVRPLPYGDATTIAVTDEQCIRSGRAGLRSYASGGVWRNVSVHPTTRADLAEMLATGRSRQSRMEQGPSMERQSPWELYATAPGTGSQAVLSSPDVQLISSLRTIASSRPVAATVRGTVVLASPAVFVQDATGGVAVQQRVTQSLKVGDEVEVTGNVRANPFSSVVEKAVVRVLWENTPMPPVSVTASQAATGAFDATFIEVEGRLASKERGLGDSLIFNLDAGPQSFRTVMNRGRGDSLFNTLKPGSMLRLRGVAVADPAYTQDLVPFALLLRSSDDAVVLAGPPWWNARHMLAIAAGTLLLAMIATFFYNRVESWRLRAVLEERERMAYEMHDTLSQSFAGIGFQLKAIREGMPRDLPKLQQQLDMASELVRHSHEETRRSIAVLRPDQPGSDGLLTALTECAHRLVEGGAVRIVATCTGDVPRVPLRVADALYHVGQEALANAIRHGQPSRLEIALAYEKDVVQLRILDDGAGFEPFEEHAGFGLRGMRKRAAGIGATLQIRSRSGSGTEIFIRSALKPPKTPSARPVRSSRSLWRQLRHVTDTGKLDSNSYRG